MEGWVVVSSWDGSQEVHSTPIVTTEESALLKLQIQFPLSKFRERFVSDAYATERSVSGLAW